MWPHQQDRGPHKALTTSEYSFGSIGKLIGVDLFRIFGSKKPALN